VAASEHLDRTESRVHDRLRMTVNRGVTLHNGAFVLIPATRPDKRPHRMAL